MELREAVLRSLRSGRVHQHGKEFPRIGYYGHDDRGIIQEILMDGCDNVPAYVLILDPIVARMVGILVDIEAGKLTPAVGRSLWRRHVNDLTNLLPVNANDPILDFDLAIDSKPGAWHAELEEMFYDLDDGSCWIFVSSSAFWKVVASMPPDPDIADVACAALSLDPRSFICVMDHDGIFVYASPEAALCSDAPSALGFVGTAIGMAMEPGEHPTFVLPEPIMKDVIETCTAAHEGEP